MNETISAKPVIAGLGNPGKQYQQTRHNMGFFVIEHLVSRWQAHKIFGDRAITVYRAKRAGGEIFLLKPQLYMNRSGPALRHFQDLYPLDLSSFIVIHDDIDLTFGRMKVKQGGGSGGHKGVKSIMDELGTADFIRIRLGIGRPDLSDDVVDYVLETFSVDEKDQLQEIIERASLGVEAILAEGLTFAMNEYNKPLTT